MMLWIFEYNLKHQIGLLYDNGHICFYDENVRYVKFQCMRLEMLLWKVLYSQANKTLIVYQPFCNSVESTRRKRRYCHTLNYVLIVNDSTCRN